MLCVRYQTEQIPYISDILMCNLLETRIKVKLWRSLLVTIILTRSSSETWQQGNNDDSMRNAIPEDYRLIDTPRKDGPGGGLATLSFGIINVRSLQAQRVNNQIKGWESDAFLTRTRKWRYCNECDTDWVHCHREVLTVFLHLAHWTL